MIETGRASAGYGGPTNWLKTGVSDAVHRGDVAPRPLVLVVVVVGSASPDKASPRLPETVDPVPSSPPALDDGFFGARSSGRLAVRGFAAS